MTNQHPLPPEIYRRRRVAALVALLVLVVFLVWGLSAMARSGGGDADVSTSTSPTTTPVTEPTVPEPGAATPSESETAKESASGEPTEPTSSAEHTQAAPSGTCELKDLRVVTSTNQPSYAVGEQPVFYMEVQNPTDADCVIDLDTNIMRFEVYDMATNNRVWSDVDCFDPVFAGQETFPRDSKRGFEARWSGTSSQPNVCTDRQPVPAGSYYLHTVIGDNASDAVPFNLT